MNQNPEQLARDKIDHALLRSCWILQSYKRKNMAASLGVPKKEYPINIGPSDNILFVNSKLVGFIEAKRPEEGVRLTVYEEQSYDYANAKLKYLNTKMLSYVYENTGELTRFTDYRDPKPRSRPVFTFHLPEQFEETSRGFTQSILKKAFKGKL